MHHARPTSTKTDGSTSSEKTPANDESTPYAPGIADRQRAPMVVAVELHQTILAQPPRRRFRRGSVRVCFRAQCHMAFLKVQRALRKRGAECKRICRTPRHHTAATYPASARSSPSSASFAGRDGALHGENTARAVSTVDENVACRRGLGRRKECLSSPSKLGRIGACGCGNGGWLL